MNKNQILKIYGTDYKEMTKILLGEGDAAALIPDKHISIGIKPNLVSPSTPDYGATTHPEIVSGIIEYLRENGFDNIYMMESSWVGARTEDVYSLCGYDRVSEKYDVPFYNLKKDTGVKTDCAGMSVNICKRALETGFLINVPVLKGHCQTNITCALKNMKGLLTDFEKRRFHVRGLHKPIAHVNTVLHQDLIVIDNICGDPGCEDGGNPETRNCIMLAMDPVLTDAYAARFLRVDLRDVRYIGLAEGLGVGSADLSQADIRTVRETGEWKDIDRLGSERALRPKDAIAEADSCSACYAALLPAVERLKDEGLFDAIGEKICIGQGYRGEKGPIGVGNCTSGFDICIKGCPPEREEIYERLRNIALERLNS